jgi:hypothetical protein
MLCSADLPAKILTSTPLQSAAKNSPVHKHIVAVLLMLCCALQYTPVLCWCWCLLLLWTSRQTFGASAAM